MQVFVDRFPQPAQTRCARRELVHDAVVCPFWGRVYFDVGFLVGADADAGDEGGFSRSWGEGGGECAVGRGGAEGGRAV